MIKSILQQPTINPKPTPFRDLNNVLSKLVTEIRLQLGNNFIGAYLQGSFATGGFTESSDADVSIIIHEDIAESEVHIFQALHERLFKDLPKPRGQHIELSYAPIEIFRRWSEIPRDPPDFPRDMSWTDPSTNSPPRVYPFWYLDNGADKLVRSEHDNSRVVRWVTREKGITLVGPDPKTLIDVVTPKDLAIQIQGTMKLMNEKWSTLEAIKTHGNQTFFVTLCARALHTLETGTVTSKKEATEWAISNLDPKLGLLFQEALASWQGPRDILSNKADISATEQTISLIKYTFDKANQRAQRD